MKNSRAKFLQERSSNSKIDITLPATENNTSTTEDKVKELIAAHKASRNRIMSLPGSSPERAEEQKTYQKLGRLLADLDVDDDDDDEADFSHWRKIK